MSREASQLSLRSAISTLHVAPGSGSHKSPVKMSPGVLGNELRIDTKLVVVGASVSVSLMAAVYLASGGEFATVSVASAVWLVPMLAAHTLLVFARGRSFRLLSQCCEGRSTWEWIGLGGRHQAVFALLPSGTGDVVFPLLAQRMVGLEAARSVNLILQVRVRDGLILATIGLTALLSYGDLIAYTPILLVVSLATLWYSDDLIMMVLKPVLSRFGQHQAVVRYANAIAQSYEHDPKRRASRVFWSSTVWICAITAVACACFAVNQSVHIREVLLIIVGINLAGALAPAIAGLGVSEVGATAALVLAGFSLEEAASVGLVVRPLLLASVVLAGLISDGSVLFARRSRRART